MSTEAKNNAVLEALGETLLSKDGPVKTAAALKDKDVLGLYFSAHWCPPCRGFTPTLSKKYTALKEAGKSFELVFVSSDRNQKAFDGYHKEMTFLALPWDNRDAKETLSELFGVSGIPSLVFVDAKTGELITDEGREEIESDKFVENFPYRPKPFDLFGSIGDTLMSKEGAVKTADALKDKDVLGLYFSAHWCPPCRGFTPTLSEKYTALKEAGKSFELVFVSSDRDQAAFDDYHKEMTFLALPFANREGKNELSKHFKVNGIPALVFVDTKTGKLITDEGRGGISQDSFIEDFPYHPKPVNDIGASMSGINSKASLVLFLENEGKDEQGKKMIAALTDLAETEKAKPEGEQKVKCFFTATNDGPIDQIRSNTGLTGTKAALLILELAKSGKFYKPAKDAEVTPDSLVAFVKDFADGKLQAGKWGEQESTKAA